MHGSMGSMSAARAKVFFDRAENFNYLLQRPTLFIRFIEPSIDNRKIIFLDWITSKFHALYRVWKHYSFIYRRVNNATLEPVCRENSDLLQQIFPENTARYSSENILLIYWGWELSRGHLSCLFSCPGWLAPKTFVSRRCLSHLRECACWIAFVRGQTAHFELKFARLIV